MRIYPGNEKAGLPSPAFRHIRTVYNLAEPLEAASHQFWGQRGVWSPASAGTACVFRAV